MNDFMRLGNEDNNEVLEFSDRELRRYIKDVHKLAEWLDTRINIQEEQIKELLTKSKQ